MFSTEGESTVKNDVLLWSLQEAARQLGGISTRSVRRMIDAGELPAVAVRRSLKVPVAAVQEWVEQNMIRAHNRSSAGPRVRKEVSTCHTVARIVPFGGQVSPTTAAKELDDLLKPQTRRRRKR